MITRKIIQSLFAFALVSAIVLSANLNCSIVPSGSCLETPVLYLENSTGGYQNAEAQNVSVNTYAYAICCDLNAVGDTVTTDCTDSTFLRLSSLTNAHVQEGPVGTYPVQACISANTGRVRCNYDTSCLASEGCLASIASSYSDNTTNAHLGDCTHYETLICCKSFSPPSVLSINLVSSSPFNSTLGNLTVYYSTSDPDGDMIYNNTDWRVNGTSIALLNMPFNTNVSENTSGAVLDYSTFKNNGTLGGGNSTNAPTWISSGVVGGAYHSNGSQYIVIGNDSSLNIGHSDYTIMFWINISSAETTPNPRILEFGWWGDGGYSLQRSGTNNQLIMYYANSSGWEGNFGTVDIAEDVWVHFAIVVEDGSYYNYINGTLISNGTAPPYTDPESGQKLTLFSSHNNPLVESSLASMDELLIIKKSFSPEQINASYQAGLAKLATETIVSQETYPGEKWSVCVTPSDTLYDGVTSCSNNVTIVPHPGWDNLTLPEGIHYKTTGSPPAGNYQYNFTITFNNLTAHSGDVLGCYVNMSDCYDDQLLGCNVTFVNKTLTTVSQNETIKYTLKSTDIVNTTLGGTTSIWIPWRVDRCGVYYSNSTPKYEEPVTWRIHVHGKTWTSSDIANSVNAKSLKNQYLMNTIKADNVGDVSYSVARYNGANVELDCRDGIDDPDDPDSAIDCADGDCRGVTYSCVAKQEFDNASEYYSPSGSHGTLAINIPEGDMGRNQTSATTFNTDIQYTMHSMPNGTFKIRFRRWNLPGSGMLATIIAEGFPNITSINKYAAANTTNDGLLNYFLDNTDTPRNTNSLNKTQTYTNKFVIKSFDNDQTIDNIDTVVNITFNNNTVNMSEGYIIQITVNYVQGTDIYEEHYNITIYFDDPTYGAPPRWNSTNENEWDIQISGTDWGPCNDTYNGDFDYLNCPNSDQCFSQSSYDCYDLDCNEKPGPTALNAYDSTWTRGVCAYYNESQTNSMCFDGYNNDWATEDSTWGHANSGLTLVDCRDSDCDKISNGSVECEYNIELNCTDGFDNDMYQRLDCNWTVGTSYTNREYDCAVECRNSVDDNETGVECDDGLDNDWDYWYRTDWSITAGPTDYALNTSTGAGLDCAWTTQNPDEDCDLEIMGNGYRCELGHEITCNDSFDNDYDKGFGEPDPGWTQTEYNLYFGTYGISYNQSADYDDYDCQFGPYTPSNESINASWCFDNIDNDLDRYYWSGAAWVENTSTGIDCADPDCIFVTNPNNANQTCLNQEYNETDSFFTSLKHPDLYCSNGLDDDVDNALGWPNGGTDCTDPDCNKKFGICAACPSGENITWDACADGLDNDYDLPTTLVDCADSDCQGWLGDYDGNICNATEATSELCSDGFDNDADGTTDCQDAGCNGIGTCQTIESNCNDDIDNDQDGNIDCADSNCYADSACNADTDLSGTYSPPTTSSSTFGGVTATWDARVRVGENYTIRFQYSSNYDDASLYVGNLLGNGIDVDTGLLAPNFTTTGPNASAFETQAYDNGSTVGNIQLYDQDHIGSNYPGFDFTVVMPTNDTLVYDSFEYSHAISGSTTSGNTIDVRILDDIAPQIKKVLTEPGDKSAMEYGSSLWVGVLATDAENGDYQDGTIDRCYYNISGPGYTQSGTDASDCKFSLSNIIDDGTYYLNISARDDTGNLARINQTNFVINLVPKYVTSSFNLTDRFYSTNDTITISSKFDTDDAATITNCSAYYKNSTGSPIFAGIMAATYSGDRVTCSGSVTVPSNDEMYELWVNISDAENDEASSSPETFYVCNSLLSQGTGTHGELWSCMYRDLNNDAKVDSCTTPEMVSAEIIPDNVTIDDNLVGYCNATDPEGDKLLYWYKWYKDGVENRSNISECPTGTVENYYTTINHGDGTCTLVYQPNEDNGKDTWIYDEWQTANMGKSSWLETYSGIDGGTGRIGRPLIEFNTSIIPSNVIVTDAKLELYLFSGSSGSLEQKLFRMISDWEEGNKTSYWPNLEVGQANWQYSKSDLSNNWNGGVFDVDYNGTVIDKITTSTKNVWYSWSLTETAEGWINGTYVNHGLMLNASYIGTYYYHNFASSSYVPKDKRPKLTITYTPIEPPYSEGVRTKIYNLSFDQTKEGETWIFSCKAGDGELTSKWMNSSPVYINAPLNSPPNITSLKIFTLSKNNWSSEDIYFNITANDTENDTIYNVSDWRLNGESIAVVNLPFSKNETTGVDGQLTDYSMHSNSGTYLGGTWNSSGRVGGAYSLNGEDVLGSIPFSDSLNTSEKLTVSIWVKPNTCSPDYGGHQRMVYKKDSYQFMLYDGSCRPEVYLYGLSTPGWHASDSVIPINQWSHVAFVFDGAKDTLRIYVNGSETKLVSSITGTIDMPSTETIIGGVSFRYYPFSGDIDELLIFNRSLSGEEINNIYEAGLSRQEVNSLSFGETTEGDNWSVCVTPSDQHHDGTALCSENMTITNGPAPAPELYLPTDGNLTLHDRTPTFVWYNSTDSDGDKVNYTIWVDDDKYFGSPEIIGAGIKEMDMFGNATNYTNSTVLSVDTLYYWKVRACDTYGGCTTSERWNFTIESYAEITLVNPSIDFGSMLPGEVNDTTDWLPGPIIVENSGNIMLEINITATDLFNYYPNPDRYFQYKIEENETASYESAMSWDWFDLNQTVYNQTVHRFNWSDVNDAFNMQVKVEVPNGEPPATRYANITISAG